MYRIALKILMGNKTKYFGLIFGVMFATLLMSQQVSIFIGIMTRTANQVRDVREADIWVMDPQVTHFDEVKSLPERNLKRVRSIEGVAWAVPLFKGLAIAQTQGGIMQQVIVMGLDDATLIGKPPQMLLGKWEDLREPTSIIIDRAGFEFIWPNDKMDIGRFIEINDQQVKIVGIAEASAPFLTFPIIFTRYTQAIQLVPGERNKMSFILVKSQAEHEIPYIIKRINTKISLQAISAKDFPWRSIHYYLQRTGIPINFGITVMLGFIIGTVIAGQTFYIFIIENLKQFATLKAIGLTNGQILRMVVLQALLVGIIGFSIGIGLCAIFFSVTSSITALRGFILHWQVVLGVFLAILCIILFASLFSIRRVMIIDPAIVFRG